MTAPAFKDAAVKQAFDAFPKENRDQLLALRALILEAAQQTEGIGPITETLKWGQPSYLPVKSNVGTTVRLGLNKDNPPKAALYVHCQSKLLDTVKMHYGDQFQFEGNRAILIKPDQPIPEQAIKHCASLALTYHLRKMSAR